MGSTSRGESRSGFAGKSNPLKSTNLGAKLGGPSWSPHRPAGKPPGTPIHNRSARRSPGCEDPEEERPRSHFARSPADAPAPRNLTGALLAGSPRRRRAPRRPRPFPPRGRLRSPRERRWRPIYRARMARRLSRIASTRRDPMDTSKASRLNQHGMRSVTPRTLHSTGTRATASLPSETSNIASTSPTGPTSSPFIFRRTSSTRRAMPSSTCFRGSSGPLEHRCLRARSKHLCHRLHTPRHRVRRRAECPHGSRFQASPR